MADTITEHLGDCAISYEAETPAEYHARTGEYLGSAEPALVGLVTLYMSGKAVAAFGTREEARLHRDNLATVAASYPVAKES